MQWEEANLKALKKAYEFDHKLLGGAMEGRERAGLERAYKASVTQLDKIIASRFVSYFHRRSAYLVFKLYGTR